jgi:thiamine-monophosphate kinase
LVRISDIGEFGLIERIRRGLPRPGADVVVGLGDDVAVLRTGGEQWLLATCDSQVEGSHFLRDKITPYQLGRRAVAINLSDVAAKGGSPCHLLVSLSLPQDTAVEWVDELYRGLQDEASRFGVEIVGGNLTRSPLVLMVDVFLLGQVEPDHLLLRSGARPGDQVLVTGTLGDAAAGLALLLDPSLTVDEDHARRVTAAHLTPSPRVREGQAIARLRAATAMMDISDGLASDVGHLCDESGVGVRLWAARLPISPAARAVAQAAGRAPCHLALFGGEDYELLLTAPPEQVEALAAAVRQATETPLTVVGEIVPAAEGRVVILPEGRAVPLEAGGWDHFLKSV